MIRKLLIKVIAVKEPLTTGKGLYNFIYIQFNNNHRMELFNDHQHFFTYQNKDIQVLLLSAAQPQIVIVNSKSLKVFVQGSLTEKDDILLEVRADMWPYLLEAALAYNNKFSHNNIIGDDICIFEEDKCRDALKSLTTTT